MLWSLYMCTEHGFARIIIIYVFNKEWQCFQICQYFLKMADILFVTMETGVWLTKVQYIIYSVRPILYFWPKKIARFAQIKKLSYLPAVCGLNYCFHSSWSIQLSYCVHSSWSIQLNYCFHSCPATSLLFSFKPIYSL